MTEPTASVGSVDPDLFPTDPSGLAPAPPPRVIRLGHGERFPLRIGPVA